MQYVEAHGTGTAVGDPIEANAIGSAIGMHRSQPCFLASVKTNIGHLEAGAGMASLIKMMLALRHRMIPKHLHFENPNPAIDLDRLHLQIPRETIPWPSQAGPRVAGINGFGYGGATRTCWWKSICHPTQRVRLAMFPFQLRVQAIYPLGVFASPREPHPRFPPLPRI
ncbi:MAG: polyketide synthase [Pirellulales bacterium]